MIFLFPSLPLKYSKIRTIVHSNWAKMAVTVGIAHIRGINWRCRVVLQQRWSHFVLIILPTEIRCHKKSFVCVNLC